jgi:hypothetical protein
VFRTELIAETRRSFAKTRTPPKGAGAGGVSGTLRCGRYEELSYEGSASQTRGRGKSSSRNVRPRKAHRTRSWKPAAALTDWTPRAGAGCPRSLAYLPRSAARIAADAVAGGARHGRDRISVSLVGGGCAAPKRCPGCGGCRGKGDWPCGRSACPLRCSPL